MEDGHRPPSSYWSAQSHLTFQIFGLVFCWGWSGVTGFECAFWSVFSSFPGYCDESGRWPWRWAAVVGGRCGPKCFILCGKGAGLVVPWRSRLVRNLGSVVAWVRIPSRLLHSHVLRSSTWCVGPSVLCVLLPFTRKHASNTTTTFSRACLQSPSLLLFAFSLCQTDTNT